MTGAELAAKAIVNLGVEYVFTLSGGHITPIYQYLENSPVTLFDTRHEQAAVFMAEAWGRMNRKPAIAMVTAGPGFTNTLSAIANARMSNTPLLLISGAVGLNNIERMDLQDIHQAPIIAPMVKKALICHHPERIPEYIDLAYRTAACGRPGPVYLELPVDVLNADSGSSPIKQHSTFVCSQPVDTDKVEQFIGLLQEAKHPIVIAGSGAWYADASEELVSFVEKTGIPAMTSAAGRGTISDTHPLCLESSLAIRPGAAMYANSDADLILCLGTRISLYYMFGAIFDRNAKFVQVDIEPEEIGRNISVDLPILSDIKAFLAHCNKVIDERKLTGSLAGKFDKWVADLNEQSKMAKEQTAPNWENENVPIHPLRLAKEVDKFLDREDDIVIADGGDTQIWMGMTRTIRRPGHYMDSGLFGCLGCGLPFANSAKLRHPDQRVCLVTGDGSTGFNFMEFETAIRKKLPIVVVISNDLGWGMIRHSQELRLGHAIEDGTFIGEVHYEKLVEDLGGKGYFITEPADIRPALEDAFSSGKTCCINVMTDPTTVSPGSIALANVGAAYT